MRMTDESAEEEPIELGLQWESVGVSEVDVTTGGVEVATPGGERLGLDLLGDCVAAAKMPGT